MWSYQQTWCRTFGRLILTYGHRTILDDRRVKVIGISGGNIFRVGLSFWSGHCRFSVYTTGLIYLCQSMGIQYSILHLGTANFSWHFLISVCWFFYFIKSNVVHSVACLVIEKWFQYLWRWTIWEVVKVGTLV